jgi:capsular polysaccharide biosynthesis protein
LGLFSSIGLKNREKLSIFRTEGTEEDPKILKSRRTKVVSSEIKQLFGGGHKNALFSPPYCRTIVITSRKPTAESLFEPYLFEKLTMQFIIFKQNLV